MSIDENELRVIDVNSERFVTSQTNRTTSIFTVSILLYLVLAENVLIPMPLPNKAYNSENFVFIVTASCLVMDKDFFTRKTVT